VATHVYEVKDGGVRELVERRKELEDDEEAQPDPKAKDRDRDRQRERASKGVPV
jgi:hypothetical protein